MTIEGNPCGAALYSFPCTQLFWALPLMEDDAPPTGGNAQTVFAKDGSAERLPSVVLPATGSGDAGDDPIDFPYYGNYNTYYVDVSPALIDDLLLFFAQHPEYPLGDYLHVQWECLYLSAPPEFAEAYPYGFTEATERIEFYCPTIVMDTCSGQAVRIFLPFLLFPKLYSFFSVLFNSTRRLKASLEFFYKLISPLMAIILFKQ